jgi:hypothetical protein
VGTTLGMMAADGLVVFGGLFLVLGLIALVAALSRR